MKNSLELISNILIKLIILAGVRVSRVMPLSVMDIRRNRASLKRESGKLQDWPSSNEKQIVKSYKSILYLSGS